MISLRANQSLRRLHLFALIGLQLAIFPSVSWGLSGRPSLETDRGDSTGSLVICGGGRLPTRVIEKFIELAGGDEAVLVVIPTATSDDSIDVTAIEQLWKSRGIDRVSVLHTRDRAQADDPAFVRPLQEATGVWISGGQQSRLAESYANTRLESELLQLHSRGGVVGGSSAGAAIMSHVMIAGGRSEPSIKEGLPLLKHAIVDQHFLRRSRVERLSSAVRQHPDLVGVGIDEGTALVVQGSVGTVMGNSYVVAIESSDQDMLRIRVYHEDQRIDFPESTAHNR